MSPTQYQPIKLLLIEDDPDDYLLTKEVVAELPGGDYTLDWIQDYQSGLDSVCRGEHDVYLIDYRIGEKSGLDLWTEASRRSCHGPMILLTGQSDYEIDQAALAAGAADFLEKNGLTATLLERAIRYAIRHRENERALAEKVAERTADLAAANDALHEAAHRKDEFLATLGHELRNPLAPMRNALEILRLGSSQPELADRARGILDRQLRTMVRLIDDLLDVARFSSGKFRLDIQRFDLRDAIHDAIEAAMPLFSKQGVELTTRLPDESLTVSGDRLRLAQVFTNVLGNAAKYTETGGRCELAAVSAGTKAVVSITDTGMGIPSDQLPFVFGMFTQVSRTLDRAQGGLGIGLALVKKLVELHDGQITVHSDGPGTGSRFDVTLPLIND